LELELTGPLKRAIVPGRRVLKWQDPRSPDGWIEAVDGGSVIENNESLCTVKFAHYQASDQTQRRYPIIAFGAAAHLVG
jgi:hypothetical protein